MNTRAVLVPVARSPHAPARRPANERRPLMDMWLSGRSPRTLKAYRDDLKDFATFIPVESPDAAAAYLVSLDHGAANELVLSYRNAMVGRLAPATINRRLGALRSLVKLANLLGHVTWMIGIENVKQEKYRDTAGPGVEKIEKMLAVLNGANAIRNTVLIRMMFDMGLRRGEVVELQREHVGDDGRVSVLGKGRSERATLSMPGTVKVALAAWLEVRAQRDGPKWSGSLFDITGHGLWSMVKAAAKKAGVGAARPHGLRHSGITRALDTHDVRSVQKFSRHKNINTLMIYDDNRKDMFGEIAESISGGKK